MVILQELGSECLAVHADGAASLFGTPVIGVAPYDAGCGSPPRVVELVVSPDIPSAALAAALGIVQSLGLAAVVCRDRPGRILDRLIRPYLNDALRSVDEQLAVAADIDFTVRMGLGFSEGPIELSERTGLLHHFRVSRMLHEAFGEPAFAPARRARIANERSAG
jgi:3-hydroxybutyryl-CoA dehydrogenase